ncbi:hypothetical protein PR048_028953 [Dryococelus australis]|uniref:Uncharacterized protein n=1 Tax=Dryococelus australis TaxID=614101 RepID=A0ABQ9GCL2_9NEOP|nr:hypothetical protein PR048_028953 [Dryococelus australis]
MHERNIYQPGSEGGLENPLSPKHTSFLLHHETWSSNSRYNLSSTGAGSYGIIFAATPSECTIRAEDTNLFVIAEAVWKTGKGSMDVKTEADEHAKLEMQISAQMLCRPRGAKKRYGKNTCQPARRQLIHPAGFRYSLPAERNSEHITNYKKTPVFSNTFIHFPKKSEDWSTLTQRLLTLPEERGRAELHSTVCTRTGSSGCCIDVKSLLSLTELHGIGANNCEVFFYWCRVAQGVSHKVWSNDKLTTRHVLYPLGLRVPLQAIFVHYTTIIKALSYHRAAHEHVGRGQGEDKYQGEDKPRGSPHKEPYLPAITSTTPPSLVLPRDAHSTPVIAQGAVTTPAGTRGLGDRHRRRGRRVACPRSLPIGQQDYQAMIGERRSHLMPSIGTILLTCVAGIRRISVYLTTALSNVSCPSLLIGTFVVDSNISPYLGALVASLPNIASPHLSTNARQLLTYCPAHTDRAFTVWSSLFSDRQMSAMRCHDNFHPAYFSHDVIRLAIRYICVQSPAGSLRNFASENRAGLCRWSADFLGFLPLPPLLHSGTALYSPRFTLIGSQDLEAGMRGWEIREIPEKTSPTSGIVRHDSHLRKS